MQRHYHARTMSQSTETAKSYESSQNFRGIGCAMRYIRSRPRRRSVSFLNHKIDGVEENRGDKKDAPETQAVNDSARMMTERS